MYSTGKGIGKETCRKKKKKGNVPRAAKGMVKKGPFQSTLKKSSTFWDKRVVLVQYGGMDIGRNRGV